MRKLSTSTLKWIAAVAMAIDHIAAIFEWSDWMTITMRSIGRIAFPIFSFVLVEGFVHTRSRKRYLQRLLFFAILTEVCFDLAFYGKIFEITHQNVLFTFAISLYVLDRYEQTKQQTIGIFYLFIGMIAAGIFLTDYNLFGVLTVFCLYVYRKRLFPITISIILINGVMAMTAPIQLFAVAAIPFFALYSGEKGRTYKYFFYVFYPGHLLLLFWLKIMWG